MESPVANKETSTVKRVCCFSFLKVNDDEKEPMLPGKDEPDYGGTDKSNEEASPDINVNEKEKQIKKSLSQKKEVKTIKVEEIELKTLNIKKVDAIFEKFQETFNLFSTSQKELMVAVEEFQTTMNTAGEFKEALAEFRKQLNSDAIVMKKLALKIPKSVIKSGGTVANAATALTKILEAYNDLKSLPAKVTEKGFICMKDILELDPSEIASEEFSGTSFDLGKIPKQMIDMKNNLKQIRKAPRIVKSFFQYSTKIVAQIIECFGNEKSKEELQKIDSKVEKDVSAKDDEMEKLENPKPPKEVTFKPVKVPSIDRIFNDIGKAVNPIAKLSNDLYKTRNALEETLKTISKISEDKTKAFNDYLDELKKRVKKGEVHIVVVNVGNSIEIKKVEGFEPNVARNIESGLNGVIKCCNEFESLGPESFHKLLKLIKHVTEINKGEIKSHLSLKELTATVSTLNENSRKAKEIPGILKFFFVFVRNLLLDISETVNSK